MTRGGDEDYSQNSSSLLNFAASSEDDECSTNSNPSDGVRESDSQKMHSRAVSRKRKKKAKKKRKEHAVVDVVLNGGTPMQAIADEGLHSISSGETDHETELAADEQAQQESGAHEMDKDDLEKAQAHAEEAEDFLKQQTDPRRRFSSKIEFLFSTAGFAVGLGNLYRFPYVAYDNGGAAFLIPYLIFIVIVAIPLLVMELTVGQVMQVSSLISPSCKPCCDFF